MPKIACNNPALPIFDEQFDQEKQQLLNDFEKLLNDKGYLDSDYSQASEIQLFPENSALATISEQDLSQIAEISFPASLAQSSTGKGNETAESSFSPSSNQPSTTDNVVHEDTALPSRPTLEVAQTRPSVIVAARSRKRANEEETNDNKNAFLKSSDDDVPPSVLEKRRKGNERCKRYRMNK